MPSSWASVQCVRLDGPRATDETLRRLAEQGARDQVTRLELASSAFSAQALQVALALPALESLRCESLTASDCVDTQTASLRRLEFRDCAGATCRALFRAAPNAKVVEIALLEPKRNAAAVHDELGNLSLRSLHLRHQSRTRRHLEAALRSSHETLKALTLDSVSGLESDQFLASVDWSALATLSSLAVALRSVADTLLQLALEGFRADGDEAYAREWSSALGATRLPALSELVVNDVSMNAEALTKLLNDCAPRLQRLAFDLKAMGQVAWVTLTEHAPADLHWIAVSDSGTHEELAWLLDDPESRISAACVSLS
ncbi:hypothetical protein Hoch_1003 [Haliangium ochraceum DSM 14365]|uniref:Uncharacterized protein n=1 Tax=Haliangium ochraceum (strain DSM 14365 / JCM 11303 / SMP-2) TaxID=502025 RepID=D0LQP3_HALO1|nr:hypothetical protein Hoch_1003 [Haliangium ochraceum DSM 14365]